MLQGWGATETPTSPSDAEPVADACSQKKALLVWRDASPSVNALENVGTEGFLWLTFLLLRLCGSADSLKKSPNSHPLLLLFNIFHLFVMLVPGYLSMVLHVLIAKQDQQGCRA